MPSPQKSSVERNLGPETRLMCLLIFLIYCIPRANRYTKVPTCQVDIVAVDYSLEVKDSTSRLLARINTVNMGRKFIKFCRFRNSDDTEGRIKKSSQRPTISMARHAGQYWGSFFGQRNERTTQPGPNANTARAPPIEDVPLLGAPFDPFVRMAYISNIADVVRTMSDECFIDCGASQSIFHQNKSFILYDIIRNKAVQAANGKSRIGKGRVEIQVGITKNLFRAFPPSEFTSNILATHILSEHFDILFSYHKQEKTYLFFIKTQICMTRISF